MVKKIGDLAIGLAILLFLIGGFSSFLNRADEVTKVNSNIGGIIKSYESNLSKVKTLETEFTEKVDEKSIFGVKTDQQIDERGQDAGGLLNLLSKNILVKFFNAISGKMQIPKLVLTLILSVIAITITLLFVRFVMGETKI